MVACSPAISHWLLTDLFLVTGYKALANTAFDLFRGSHAHQADQARSSPSRPEMLPRP